jgi:uncharacterized protein YbjT (DUF2867 family)
MAGAARRKEFAMITVMGATGNTGRVVAETLLDRGERVRALGRSADRLKELADRGAEVLIGDITDAAYLEKAFGGSDAVYALFPPAPQSPDYRALQDRYGLATVEAIQKSGVRYVVNLGSIGHSTTCPVAGVLRQESRLKALSGVNVLALHAGFFFENHFLGLARIKRTGSYGTPIASNVPIPMIAARDIGVAAAEGLRRRDFEGFVVRELLGERDLTMTEATQILGRAIGMPDLRYAQISDGEFRSGLLELRLSENMADLIVDAFRGHDEGRMRSAEGRNRGNTTPTRFETFADVFARAFHAT